MAADKVKDMRLIEKVEVKLDRVVYIFNEIAIWAVALMAFIQLYEVVTRITGFGVFTGAYEFAEWLLVLCTYFCLTYAWRAGAHIKVTILYARYRPRMKEVADQIIRFLALMVFGVIMWFGFVEVIHSKETLEYLPGATIPIPLYWARLFVPIGSLLFCLMIITEIIVHFTRGKEVA